MGASIGGGGDERIALLVETTSKLDGIKAARAETQAYANDVRAISGAASTVGAIVTESATQQVASWASAGKAAGDFNGSLASVVSGEQAVAAAAVATGTQVVTQAEKQVVAMDAVAAGMSQAGKAAAAAGTGVAVMTTETAKAAAQNEYGSRAAVAAGKSYDSISPKARTAAASFAVLSQIAITSNGSLSGVANAAGVASSSIAAMATSARVAALASGIGAIVTVGAAVIGILIELNQEAKATAAQLEHVGNINIHGADSQLELAKTQLAQAQAYVEQQRAVHSFYDEQALIPGTDAHAAEQQLSQARAYFDAVEQHNSKLKISDDDVAKNREKNYQRQFADQALSLQLSTQQANAEARGLSDLDSQTRIKHQQMTDQLQLQQRQIRQSFEQRDAQGEIIPLTANEVKYRTQLLRLANQLNTAQQKELDRQTELTKMAENAAAQTRIQQALAAQATGTVGGKSVAQQRLDAAIAGFQAEEDAAIRAGEDRVLAEKETAVKILAVRAQMEEDSKAAALRIQTAAAEANPHDVTANYNARMAQIESERQAAIKAGEDEGQANAEAQQKIAVYRKQVAVQAVANYAAITSALLGSNSRAAKAIATVGETIRKVMIGADGAHSAVLAIKEGAAAIGSAAAGDFRGAALHAASALEYGKAAALALTESLGSGGNTAAGGGGGGSSTTFEPSDNKGSGNQVLVLNTVDPYSGAAINSVAYELQRGQVLNKPIFIPPTTGFAAAGG